MWRWDMQTWLKQNAYTLVVALILFGVAWGGSQVQIGELEKKYVKQETKFETHCVKAQGNQMAIVTKIAKIETRQEFMAANIQEVKETQKEILSLLRRPRND